MPRLTTVLAAAAAGVTLLATSAVATPDVVDDHMKKKPTLSPTHHHAPHTSPTAPTLPASDADVLKYALTLELLESAFYNYVVGNATLFKTFPAGAKQYVPLVQAHENAHVNILSSALNMTTAAAAAYFGCQSYPYFREHAVDYHSFLGIALALENTGVSAYDFAIGGLTDPTLTEVAATIATIEGRHAALLSVLQGADFVNYTKGAAQFEVGVDPKTARDYANPPALVASTLVTGGLLSNCSKAQAEHVTRVVERFSVPALPAYYKTRLVNATETLTNAAVKDVTLSDNDRNTAMYAATLEALEATFYAQVVANFTEAKFRAAGFPAGTYMYFEVIAQHEKAHYDFFAADLGHAVPKPCEVYSWANALPSSVTVGKNLTVQQVVAIANLLETTGVSAYTGAMNTLTSPVYKQVAATIATVEARHSSYLRSLTSVLSSPTPVLTAGVATDPTLTPRNVVGVVKALFAHCNVTTHLPPVLPVPAFDTVPGGGKKPHHHMGRRLLRSK